MSSADHQGTSGPGEDPTSPDPTGAGEAQPGARSRRTWVVAGAAALAVVALAGWLVTRGGEPADPSAAPASSTSAPAPGGSASPSVLGTAGSSPEQTAGAGDDATAGADPGAPEPAPGEGRPTAEAVALDDVVEPASGVQVRLAEIEPVDGTATVPGEVGGPSVRVTVEVTNGTRSRLDLRGVAVNLYTGAEQVPAIPLLEPGASDLPGSVEAGESATGRFVFLVPAEQREQAVVELDLSVDAPVSLFTGTLPPPSS